MWVKKPTAAASVACAAAVVAAAAAVPAIEAATNSIEKSESTQVDMAALSNIATLDAFSALPGYAAFIANPSEATLADLLTGSASTDATGVFASILATGDINYLTPGYDDPNTPATDPSPGYDVVGALPLYLAALGGDPSALTGIDAVSGVPNYAKFLETGDTSDAGLGGIDAFSAVQYYQAALNGDPSALANIDAVSAVPNIVNFIGNGDLSRESGLSGIDAFSALPTYKGVITDGEGALAPDSTGAGGLDAFSAVPGLLGIPAVDPAPDFPSKPVTAVAPFAKTAGAPEALAPAAEPGTEKVAAKEEKKPGLGLIRDSLKAEPTTKAGEEILFGNGSAPGGMPGWNKMLKKLGVPGADSEGSEGGGEGGGE